MPGTKDPSNPSRYKKGRSGNPSGSSRKARELKGLGLERLTHKEVCVLGSAMLKGSLDELAAIRDKPNVSVQELWVASLIVNAIKTQDAKAWHMLMDRIVGKPREYVHTEHTGEGGGPIKTQAMQTQEQMEAELELLHRRRQSYKPK